MQLDRLGASLLGNLLSGKGAARAGEGIVRAGYGNKKKLILEIICLKNGIFIINLDEYADVGTQCIVLYVKNNDVIYFGSFGVEHVLKETKKFIGHKSIKKYNLEYKQTIQ